MSYKSDTIATMVRKRLNQNHFLPAIQREFVWNPQQISALFDSLMRGYPISSFLFWELDSEHKKEWDAYEFLKNVSQRGSHNEIASKEGVQQLTLILDGQQRLTALNVGLRGSYETKKYRAHYHREESWVKRRLFLDLLKNPSPRDEEEGGEGGMRYRFSFRSEQSDVSEAGHYWFKVGDILDAPSADALEDLIENKQQNLPEGTTSEQIRAFNRNLRRLHEVVWRDEIVWHHTETEQDYDRVLDIFVRANSGGTPLTKSDLLLSMITARWREVNAREEIYNFVDRINGELSRPNSFDKDFIMKTCLVLCDLPVAYRVQNFSDKNLGLIFENWEKIKAAIEAGVGLANHFGIDRGTLLSANALIPVIYYLYSLKGAHTLRGATKFEAENAAAIRRWLTSAMLGNVFSGASDTMLRETRQIIQEERKLANGVGDFPVQALDRRIAELGRSSKFDEALIDETVSLSYGNRRTFLALTLLYDRKDFGITGFHQDHIFPRAWFTDEKLEASGIPEDKREHFRNLCNSLGNLQLLLPHENEEKSAKDFAEWVETRDTNFKKEHLIPEQDGLLAMSRFEDFITAREEMVKERLRKTFQIREANEKPFPNTEETWEGADGT